MSLPDIVFVFFKKVYVIDSKNVFGSADRTCIVLIYWISSYVM